MDKDKRIDGLLAANTQLVLKGRELKRHLEKARDQFKFYAKEHLNKAEKFDEADQRSSGAGTNHYEANRSREKAIVNEMFAQAIQETLDAYHEPVLPSASE